MGSRALQLVIQSAQGLRNEHSIPQLRKLNPSAVVSILDSNNNPHSSEVETPTDSEGNTNPKWNFQVTFNIDITSVQENHLVLVVKLKSRRNTSIKDVGVVRVPITELEGYGDANAVAERHMSRNVVNLDGTPQQGEGRLNFSYKFGPFGNTVQHAPASTVNIENYPTPNAQRRPGTARRLVERFTGDFGSALVATGGALAATAAFSRFNGGGESGNDQQVADQDRDADPNNESGGVGNEGAY